MKNNVIIKNKKIEMASRIKELLKFSRLACVVSSRQLVCQQTRRPYISTLQLSRCLTTKIENSSQKPPAKKDEFMRFGNRKYTREYVRQMAIYYQIMIASLFGIVFSSIALYKKYYNQAKAHSVEELEGEVSEQKDVEKKSLHKSEAGFKERKIIEYENRIRAYSTPDKIFRYFATLQDHKTGEIFMMPEDFVRALTPDTMQLKGFGLDQFKKFDSKTVGPYVSKHFGNESVFHSLGDGGLISFSDYIFLLTVLGTSARHIDIAFKMFDINGDGEVTVEEFKKVRCLFFSMTTTGSRHRDRKTTGIVLSDTVNMGLIEYFFGKDGLNKLTVDEFVLFKRRLQQEVMNLEFNSFNPKNGIITEKGFAEILLTYANFPNMKKVKIIKRINENYGKKEHNGLKFEDYLNFFSFLLNISDIEMALSFHTIAGQTIDKETFKQVAKTVAGVDLRDHLVDVVFCIFDENQDGKLSNKEFISVMKDKMFRGLNKPKDTGFTRFLSAILTCAKMHIVESWMEPNHTH